MTKTDKNDSPANFHGIVSTDGAGGCLPGPGGPNDPAASGNNILPFPNHRNDGARDDVLHQPREEGLVGKVGIVLLCKGPLHIHELHPPQVESFLLEPADDVSNQASLDAVRLDHDEGLLHLSKEPI
jgi:hypothetical protein